MPELALVAAALLVMLGGTWLTRRIPARPRLYVRLVAGAALLLLAWAPPPEGAFGARMLLTVVILSALWKPTRSYLSDRGSTAPADG
jgi:hypothetical protein